MCSIDASYGVHNLQSHLLSVYKKALPCKVTLPKRPCGNVKAIGKLLVFRCPQSEDIIWNSVIQYRKVLAFASNSECAVSQHKPDS